MATDGSCSRLAALPNELLHGVLRTAGRPTRLVCRLFCITYGPLDGGICLEHFSNGRDLRRLIATASSPAAFRHIRTLLLHPSPSNTNPPESLLSPVPAAFPALRSLHLGPGITLKPAILRALSPLAPHLTALSATVHSDQAAPLATTLSSLRSLSLVCRATARSVSFTAFRQGSCAGLLSSLRPLAPSLLHLTLDTPNNSLHWPDLTLPHLTAFTALTHLALAALPATFEPTWGAEAVRLFPTSMPSLQSLHCAWQFEGHITAAPTTEDVLAALATRTALTSLSLAVSNTPYARLHPLRLSHLTVQNPDTTLDPCLVDLLQTLGQPQTLTSLHVSGSASLPSLTQALPILSFALRTLAWHMPFIPSPPAALLPLRQLTHLESLHLTLFCPKLNGPEALTDSRAATIANALTRLTSLTLTVTPRDRSRQYPLAVLVRQVASRGTLRHLALDCWQPCWGEALLAPLGSSLVRLSVTMLDRDVWESMQRLGHLRALRNLCIKVASGIERVWATLPEQAARGVGPGAAESSSLQLAACPSGSQGAAGASTRGGLGAGASTSRGMAAGISSFGGMVVGACSSEGAVVGASSKAGAASGDEQQTHEAAGGSTTTMLDPQVNAGRLASVLGAPHQSARLQDKKQQQAAEGSAEGSVQQAGHGSSGGQQGPGATQQTARGRPEGSVRPAVRLPPGLRQLCLDVVWGDSDAEARSLVQPVLAAAARQDCAVRIVPPMAPLSSWRPEVFDDCHGYRDGAAAGFVGAGAGSCE